MILIDVSAFVVSRKQRSERVLDLRFFSAPGRDDFGLDFTFTVTNKVALICVLILVYISNATSFIDILLLLLWINKTMLIFKFGSHVTFTFDAFQYLGDFYQGFGFGCCW